jgi:hypothetical protein
MGMGRSSSGSSGTSRRGFASMPREEVRRIGRMGGEASHKNQGQSNRSSSGNRSQSGSGGRKSRSSSSRSKSNSR